MTRDARSTPLPLAAGRIHALRRARGQQIVCLRGELWITVDGDLEDHFVRAGETFVIDTAAPVVLSAVEDSAFRVIAPRAGTTGKRWWSALRNAFA